MSGVQSGTGSSGGSAAAAQPGAVTAVAERSQDLPRPVKPVAAGTSAVELARLARQEQACSDCDPLSVQVVIWLLRAYNTASADQADELRPLGLSPSGFNVLMALFNTRERTLEPCQLAERLLVSRPSITGLLDTLETKRLVVRAPHEADRRRVLVHLTGAGEQLLADHFPAHYRQQAALVAALSTAEQAELVRLLRLVADTADAPAPPT